MNVYMYVLSPIYVRNYVIFFLYFTKIWTVGNIVFIFTDNQCSENLYYSLRVMKFESCDTKTPDQIFLTRCPGFALHVTGEQNQSRWKRALTTSVTASESGLQRPAALLLCRMR